MLLCEVSAGSPGPQPHRGTPPQEYLELHDSAAPQILSRPAPPPPQVGLAVSQPSFPASPQSSLGVPGNFPSPKLTPHKY